MLWCSRANVVIVLVLALVASAAARADDELLDYLERLRLQRLVVEHLERELNAGAIGEQRQRIVDRLAEVYPELLERDDDPARRDDLVKRASVLIEKEGPKRAESLRLALLRARYRGASRVAEDFRAALCDEEAAKTAAATLAVIIDSAKDLHTRLDARAKELEKKGDRTGGLEGDKIVERADVLRGMSQETLGLQAWSNYYRSVLTADRALAQTAQQVFARVIDTGDSFPLPKDVSVDLRSNELFANALLGMALAKARNESIAAANEWLNLLDIDRVSPTLRKTLPAWRLVIAIDRSEWSTARDILKAAAADPNAPAAWLRIAAVGGLRGTGDAATALAREAMAALASRRELGQIADLARRFGDKALGDTGFASRYVRGITSYERARAAKERGEKSSAAEGFHEASQHFEAALKASDAGQFESAIGSCRALAGWCRFERGDYTEALVFFTDAAALDPRDEEPEWMALVVLEKIVSAAAKGDKRKELEGDLRTRIDGFLGRHPSSKKVPDLIVRRMALTDAPRREDLEHLLAMDDATSGAAEAKRQAVLGLYKLFRETRGAERAAAGKRFLEVMRKLAPVGAHPLPGLPAGDVAVARQALEISLSTEASDPDAAEPILEAFTKLAASKALDITPFESELALRHLQLAIARDRLADAIAQLDVLERGTTEAALKSLDLARRHVFRFAGARVRDQTLGVGGADRATVLAATTRCGDALLSAAGGAGPLAKLIEDPVMEAVAATVAYAFAEATAATGGSERGLTLATALLAKKPKDPELLETTAKLARSGGNRQLAADCFRQLVAGSALGSDRWYAAKVALIETLAEFDPTQARAVLEQHKALQPDFGPSPYRERFKAIEEKLGTSSPGGAP